jgi:uncharacterized protein (DUF2267 family)
MKKIQREQFEQMAVIEWFQKAYPRLAKCLSASANGGKRETKIVKTKKGPKKVCPEGARLKKMGVLKGELDLFLSLIATPIENQHTKFLAGLYIEMKWGKGKVSKQQQEIIDLRVASGYQVAVCYDAEDAIKVITAYLKHAVLPGSIEALELRKPNYAIEVNQLNQVPAPVLQCVSESQEPPPQSQVPLKVKSLRRKKALTP